MQLRLVRSWKTDKSTIGQLYIDGEFECYTLEDVVRAPGVKIPGETAIPAGTYKVVIDFSNRFQRNMPHLLDVPEFEGIRIHPGNTNKDTEGCILVGDSKSQDFISHSREAFGRLYDKLRNAISDRDKVEITILEA